MSLYLGNIDGMEQSTLQAARERFTKLMVSRDRVPVSTLLNGYEVYIGKKYADYSPGRILQ